MPLTSSGVGEFPDITRKVTAVRADE